MKTTRRLIGRGASAAVVWAAIAGCSSQPKSPPPQQPVPSAQQQAQPASPTQQPDAQPDRKVDQMQADAQSAETAESAAALARKAEAYSREMSPLLYQRAASRASGAGAGAATPPPEPSAVQWMDPSQFRIGGDYSHDALQTSGAPALPPQREDRAAVQPVIDRAPAGAEQVEAPNNPPRTAVASAIDRTQVLELKSSPAQAADALVEKISKRQKDYPNDVSAQLDYQLLQFLMDEPAPRLSALSSLASEDREVISALLDGLTNFRNALRADNNMLLSKKIKPILDIAERLRAQADLTIPTIALCTRVAGFGSYDPIDPARFDAGADHPVIVYCEIANFTSNLSDKQMWETRLTWDLTLYTEQGMSVWSDKTESITDTCRDRRHDFFVRKMITLPKALTIGRYLLKVSIVDTQSNRVAEATVPIVIAAQ